MGFFGNLSAEPTQAVSTIIKKIGDVKKQQVGIKIKSAQVKRQRDKKKSDIARTQTAIKLKQQKLQTIKK